MAGIPKNVVEASEFCTRCWKWQIEHKKLLPSFQGFIFMQVKPFKLTRGMRQRFHAIQKAMANPEALKDVPADGAMVREPRPRVRKSKRKNCECSVAPTQSAPDAAVIPTPTLESTVAAAATPTGVGEDAEDVEAAGPTGVGDDAEDDADGGPDRTAVDRAEPSGSAPVGGEGGAAAELENSGEDEEDPKPHKLKRLKKASEKW